MNQTFLGYTNKAIGGRLHTFTAVCSFGGSYFCPRGKAIAAVAVGGLLVHHCVAQKVSCLWCSWMWRRIQTKNGLRKHRSRHPTDVSWNRAPTWRTYLLELRRAWKWTDVKSTTHSRIELTCSSDHNLSLSMACLRYDFTAALDVMDKPLNYGGLHSESPQGGFSQRNGLPWRGTPEEAVPWLSTESSPVPTPTCRPASAPTSIPAPVSPKATTRRTSHHVSPRRVTPAVKSGQATTQNRTPAVTYDKNPSSYTSATIADIFRPDTGAVLTKFGRLKTVAPNIPHHADNRGTPSSGYTRGYKYIQEWFAWGTKRGNPEHL